ncbi:flavodoxin [Hydrogenispora ethanolica]|uniref:Flavodoxin n=1 Tax=Hydrogenispora ethanolica TaxID=1082276 RepID=A0A4V2QET9_HYDET|nr:flavodoxin [Hydrogenispora ethanolica]TCL69327.1 flavodoxin [Hydrogenispora ethanolica]
MSNQLRKLVVFYSLEGNTRLMASAIAAASGADLLELKPEQDINPQGFMKFFWGGRQVMTKKAPPLLPLAKDPADYELLFIGTPVWAFSFAPALNTFFHTSEIKGKKVALFCCHEGGRGKTFENMRRELAGNEIIGEIDFIAPRKKGMVDENEEKARKWAEALVRP